MKKGQKTPSLLIFFFFLIFVIKKDPWSRTEVGLFPRPFSAEGIIPVG